MSGGFGLVVRFALRDAEAAAGFDALVARTLPEIGAHEPGTLVYTVHAVPGEPLLRIFYELYADRRAFDAHEAQPHTVRFLAEREQYLSGVEVTFLEAVAGSGGRWQESS
ncbi:antibiotic biosynthesis monooxygenase [Streptacidiphilus sp. PB12-B1b]|uniref:putative quinol monooxygenase n=1 Tax=Streptacidiphilus sp. PB12-B1b TaxID=2705012 RepID=UPI0015FD260C|nr:antibiotic biosynthesis monooxygenase [Streptacidiphilus sp. PB12-B1b]QMU75684.1 antibiotic biosynthesis monooxygenase [Streptacidiphilus sp. PB12-B1b]